MTEAAALKNAQLENTSVALEARGISKSFPGVQALDGVDLTLRRG